MAAEVEVVEDAPAEVSRLAFVLNAVIIAEGERIALMYNPVNGKLSRLREGDEIENWLVDTIHYERVVLTNAGEVYEISLRTFSNLSNAAAQSIQPASTDKASGATRSSGAEDADIRRPRRPKRGPRKSDLGLGQ